MRWSILLKEATYCVLRPYQELCADPNCEDAPARGCLRSVGTSSEHACGDQTAHWLVLVVAGVTPIAKDLNRVLFACSLVC